MSEAAWAGRPPGLLRTLGIVLAVLVAGQALQVAFVTAMLAAGRTHPATVGAWPETFSDGYVQALLLSAPLQLLLILRAAGRRGRDLRRLLALDRLPTLRQSMPPIVALVAVVVAGDALSQAMGRPVVPPYQSEIYQTAARNGGLVGVTLLWIAVAAAAPAIEELLFRGIGYAGFRCVMRSAAAMTLSIAIWTVLHLQYDAFDMMCVASVGTVFGWARIRSGTIALPIVLHVATNLYATWQTAAAVGWPT